MRIVPLLCLALLFMWAILFRPGYAEHDMGLIWVIIGLGIGFASLIFAFHSTRNWPTITRGLLAFAVGACFVGLGHWAQLAATPWLQESGRLPNDVVFWPALIVLGIPGIICAALYRIGIDDARQIKLTGFEAGVLPRGYHHQVLGGGREGCCQPSYRAALKQSTACKPLGARHGLWPIVRWICDNGRYRLFRIFRKASAE